MAGAPRGSARRRQDAIVRDFRGRSLRNAAETIRAIDVDCLGKQRGVAGNVMIDDLQSSRSMSSWERATQKAVFIHGQRC